ncbi:FadR/GntR family transcriptional regulator [uncultured Roseobacter sp.]|uniref:FadR/GntR family transcriptional regulator n=1 Tax=uncultured Roseobacter sp. TaxID=114847 RepID=UPI002615A0DC|nr:FCD domain-containing protein [uncultured Roseobacter sp.]
MAGLGFKALPSGSSSRDVLRALSEAIETNNLSVGDRLPPEIEIARGLGISRAKVREALTSWQNMGIVTRNKKAGTRLATEVVSNAIHLPVTLKLEAESLLRTHAVRHPLEVESVRLAARNATEQDKRIIMARALELMAVHASGEDWRAADYRFHGALQNACGNPLFGQLIQQIQQGFNEVYEAPFGQPHLGEESIPMHLPLAEAVIEGDAESAGRNMETILDQVEGEIRKVMEDMGA